MITPETCPKCGFKQQKNIKRHMMNRIIKAIYAGYSGYKDIRRFSRHSSKYTKRSWGFDHRLKLLKRTKLIGIRNQKEYYLTMAGINFFEGLEDHGQ